MIMRHLSPKSLASGRRTEITWLCRTETQNRMVPLELTRWEAGGRAPWQLQRLQLPNYRIGRADGPSPGRTSLGFWRRSIAHPQAAPAPSCAGKACIPPVSYTHLRAHETGRNLVCRLLLEKKKKK